MNRHSTGSCILLTALLILGVAGCSDGTAPSSSGESYDLSTLFPPDTEAGSAGMGTLHNQILTEFYSLQPPAAKADPDWDGTRTNLVQAYENVCGEFPPGFGEAKVADDVIADFHEVYDPESGTLSPDFSFLTDSGERAWAEGLFFAIEGCTSAEETRAAINGHIDANGLPTQEPLVSYLDVALNSVEYWGSAYPAKGWREFWKETGADALGAVEGFVIGSFATPAVGFGYGLFKGVSYSVCMHAYHENQN